MFFKYTTISEVIFHALKDNPVTLHPDDSHEIILRGLTEEELRHIKVYHLSGFMVTVTWTRDVPRKVLPMFEALAQHRLPEGSEKVEADNFFRADGTINYGDPPLNEDGTPQRYRLSAKILPQPIQVFNETISKELPEYASNLLRVLRWRGNASGPHQPLLSALT